MRRHYYIELTEGEKVIKRKKTSMASENKDRRMMERYHAGPGQKISLVISSVKEKVIN